MKAIPIVPICHSGLHAIDLPIPLSLLQAVEACEEAGIERLYKLVANTLGSRVPKTDFGMIAASVREFEARYGQTLHAKAPALTEPTSFNREIDLQTSHETEEDQFLEILRSSQNNDEVEKVIGYFQANPTPEALQLLAAVADRESVGYRVRDAAVSAIGR
jgi:hypothetical protein